MGNLLTTTTITNNSSSKFYVYKYSSNMKIATLFQGSSIESDSLYIVTPGSAKIYLHDKSEGTEIIKIQPFTIEITHKGDTTEVVVNDFLIA